MLAGFVPSPLRDSVSATNEAFNLSALPLKFSDKCLFHVREDAVNFSLHHGSQLLLRGDVNADCIVLCQDVLSQEDELLDDVSAPRMGHLAYLHTSSHHPLGQDRSIPFSLNTS